jgi:hypothetical protein
VERFASAIMLYEERGVLGAIPEPERTRMLASDAQLAGFYAAQLDAWAALLPRKRLMVFQYERVRSDPVAAVEAVWARLGFDPVPLRGVDAPSSTSTKGSWSCPDHVRRALVALYRPDVERLAAEWEIDLQLWPNFARPRGLLCRGPAPLRPLGT